MKLRKSFISTIIAMVMAFVMMPSVLVNAADINAGETRAILTSKTVTASDGLALYLPAGQGDTSNIVSFKFSTIPADAEITKIVIDGGKASTSGMGIVVPGTVTLTSPDGYSYNNPWGMDNIITITKLGHKNTSGVWNMYCTANNYSSSNSAILTYSTVKLTIYYYA